MSGGGGQGAPGEGPPAPSTAVVVGQLPLRVLPASADRPKPDKPILRRRVSAASPVPDTVVSPPRPRRPVAGRAVLAKRGNIVPVACQGMTGECSGALDCPCHACIETARAAVSLGSGRLGLFLLNGGDAPLVYRLSKSQGPVVTVGSLSSYDWSQAHVVVDQTCVDDYVLVRFPSTPRPLPSSGRFVGCFLFFDRPHGLAEECDAQLLEWAKAEELRQDK